ncbi:MAG: hypothetical protein QGI78_03445 [Phycisphaerales bacterium]|jgi:hypothetical protein|nr:hypothetical protein [Phycisphaerales bacterium]
MNVALVSCEDLPSWEIDDKPLVASLESMGAAVQCPAWTSIVDWDQFDITVIRTTWDYHPQKDAFVSWCKEVPRLFNNAEIVDWNTHKSYLRELENKGTQIAPTKWVSKGDRVDIDEIMEEWNCARGFIKPQVGACASDTLRFSINECSLAQKFLELHSDQDMVVQPYIETVETVGELSAIFIDGSFTHGVQKIPVEGDYRVQDDFGASDVPYTFSKSEIEQMCATLQTVQHHQDLLYARFDYLVDTSGSLLLNELELVEPSLFFRHCRESAEKFAAAILKRV